MAEALREVPVIECGAFEFFVGRDGLQTLHPDKRAHQAADMAAPLLQLAEGLVRDYLRDSPKLARQIETLIEDAICWIRAAEMAEQTDSEVALRDCRAHTLLKHANLAAACTSVADHEPERGAAFVIAQSLADRLSSDASLVLLR